jgi:copper chaperone
MPMIEMTLPDLSCGHCVRAVTETVRRLDGAAKVDIDLATKCVRIESQLSREQLAAALSAEGYPPSPAG